MFAVLFQMVTISQKRVAELKVAALSLDVLVRPGSGDGPPNYRSVGTSAVAGYRAAKAALPRIRALCG